MVGIISVPKLMTWKSVQTNVEHDSQGFIQPVNFNLRISLIRGQRNLAWTLQKQQRIVINDTDDQEAKLKVSS